MCSGPSLLWPRLALNLLCSWGCLWILSLLYVRSAECRHPYFVSFGNRVLPCGLLSCLSLWVQGLQPCTIMSTKYKKLKSPLWDFYVDEQTWYTKMGHFLHLPVAHGRLYFPVAKLWVDHCSVNLLTNSVKSLSHNLVFIQHNIYDIHLSSSTGWQVYDSKSRFVCTSQS